MRAVLCETGEVANTYAAYLSTLHWKATRNRIVSARVVCEKCGKEDGLSVHHKTYDRLGRELDDDLSLLCQKCHGEAHPMKDWSDLPIEGRATRESRPVMFAFTMQDLADAIGKPFWNVSRDRGLGLFDPLDLKSVLEYAKGSVTIPQKMIETIAKRIVKESVKQGKAKRKRSWQRAPVVNIEIKS